VITLLMLAAFAAGVVDAIAGGGGLITLPALLAAGLPPAAALATNKGQAVFGAAASTFEFTRRGAVDRARAPYSFVAAALGSLLGAWLVLRVSPATLRPVLVALLPAAAAASLLKRPSPTTGPPTLAARAPRRLAIAIALALGFYDGFFGPGTGTLLLFAYAYFFGDALVSASGNAKVANLASNLAAFVFFAASGNIRWAIALPMAAAQFAGAAVGAALAVRKGAALVRAAAVTVSIALATKVLLDVLGKPLWSLPANAVRALYALKRASTIQAT
jgi:uncharacterized membrane protein YfcA